MDGIEKITARIQQDAQAEVKRLMEETDQKVNAIMAEAQAQAEKEGLSKLENYIVKDDVAHMAHLAIFACRKVNGVAQMHTEILKKDTFLKINTFFYTFLKLFFYFFIFS